MPTHSYTLQAGPAVGRAFGTVFMICRPNHLASHRCVQTYLWYFLRQCLPPEPDGAYGLTNQGETWIKFRLDQVCFVQRHNLHTNSRQLLQVCEVPKSVLDANCQCPGEVSKSILTVTAMYGRHHCAVVSYWQSTADC